MGLIDDKKNIFTSIGSFSSLNIEDKLPDTTNIFTSINNENDTSGFLTDVLKSVKGSTGVKDLTGELFTTFIDDVETKIKTSVKEQLIQYNSDTLLPDSFKNIGVGIKGGDIDVFGKLKENPGGEVGDLLYNKVNENFDFSSYQAIVAEGTEVKYKNLLVKYDSALDKFNYRPDISINPNATISEWFGEYVDSTSFLDKKEFIANSMDSIFGSITSMMNKTVDQVSKEIEITNLLNEIIKGNTEPTINVNDYDKIQKKSEDLVNGVVTYDMGCGLIKTELPISGMTNLIQNISGSTDPFFVANEIENTIKKSFSGENEKEINDKNKETINDGFFSLLIETIKLELSKVVAVSPQARMLLSLSSSFENEGIPQIGDPRDDIKKFALTISCIISDVLSHLFSFIYGVIVTSLIALLDPAIRKIIKEKINQYVGIVKSLISSKLSNSELGSKISDKL